MSQLLLTQGEYFLRIAVAALCGACIGYERESRMKTAGIRTHLIVAIAAALMMVVSKYGFFDVLSDTIRLDPARVAASVVSAIGFLGAGVIFVREQTISGITTAAGIWATVGVGIAIGAGLYLLGIAVTLLLLVVQVILHRGTRLRKDGPSGVLVAYSKDGAGLEQEVLSVLALHKVHVQSMSVQRLEDGAVQARLHVRYPVGYGHQQILSLLDALPALQTVEG